MNGHAVIYVAETDPSRVLQQISEMMRAEDHDNDTSIKIEDYVSSGALTIIDKDEFYSPEKTQQLDPRNLNRSWQSLILQTRRRIKLKFKRLMTIGNPSILLDLGKGIDYRHKMIEFEWRISSETIPRSVEIICWYNSPKIHPKLSFADLVSILNAHDATIHTGRKYRQWYGDTIISYVQNGIDDVLGNGASNLIFKTLRMVYNLDPQATITSKPELFEEKVTKIIGRRTAKIVFKKIIDTIKREMAFNSRADVPDVC